MLLNFKSPASLVLVVIVTVVTGPVAVFEGPELPVWRLAGDPTADRVAVARPVDVAETVKTALSVSGPRHRQSRHQNLWVGLEDTGTVLASGHRIERATLVDEFDALPRRIHDHTSHSTCPIICCLTRARLADGVPIIIDVCVYDAGTVGVISVGIVAAGRRGYAIQWQVTAWWCHIGTEEFVAHCL
jgi:hypothetical protein